MAFVLLRDEDGNDFLCNSTNIASIQPDGRDCVVTVHRGTRVKDYADRAPSRLQSQFRLNAGPQDPLRAAIDLADEIAHADREAKTLDLRHRCPPPVEKRPFDPGLGW
jgi:hypothetical protein